MTYQFDRYINGVLMAEGVTIERAENVNHAMKKAAKLASKGPREETPVLVLKTTDEIERLRKALRFMLDNDRNLQKPLEKLFAEFCNEARKALGETEPEELGEKE